MYTETQKLWAEANLRSDRDGIPRYITDDGVIMKCDWILSDEYDNLDGETH